MSTKARNQEIVRTAFVVAASEGPATVLAAITALGREETKAMAIEGSKRVTSKKVQPEGWAHQMSTAAALYVMVFDPAGDQDKDDVAEACVTRAKASSKSTKECKAKGTGDKLVGAVSQLIEAKNQKAALADIRKAQGTGRGGSRGPKDATAVPALVRTITSKIESFEKAQTNSSPKAAEKASELLQALRLLEKIEEKATGSMVKVSMASGE